MYVCLEEERPKSSRGRRSASQETASSSLAPASPEHQPSVHKEKDEDRGASSPPVSPKAAGEQDNRGEDVGSPQGTPQSRGKGMSGIETKQSFFCTFTVCGAQVY